MRNFEKWFESHYGYKVDGIMHFNMKCAYDSRNDEVRNIECEKEELQKTVRHLRSEMGNLERIIKALQFKVMELEKNES